MSLLVTPTALNDVLLIEPKIHGDRRGSFFEIFHRQRYRDAGIASEFVQDNFSFSVQGTLRGLHYQARRPQAKLVMALSGRIFDVAVDIRPGSPTYRRWVGVILSGEQKNQLFIPAGFAHGFCVLSESAEVLYKCSDFFDPEDDRGILWSDPELAIEWPVSAPILSDKDASNPKLSR